MEVVSHLLLSRTFYTLVDEESKSDGAINHSWNQMLLVKWEIIRCSWDGGLACPDDFCRQVLVRFSTAIEDESLQLAGK